jgi:L-alanine-DL-glutamate epimerase-like enolase superfamily enzyme
MESVKIHNINVFAFSVPTEAPESDGTFEWEKTTMVLVEIFANDKKGTGYTYSDTSTAVFIRDNLCSVVNGMSALDISLCQNKMQQATRNLGRSGISAMAISAVDNALWDLKARLLNLPLTKLIGQINEKIPLYGSGGYTSYSSEQLKNQFEKWADLGITMFKMKVGRNPEEDIQRVKYAREIVGKKAKLFVDANGALHPRKALFYARKFSEYTVSWFEEPVISDNLEGLKFIRQSAPEGMDISAGEYGYDLYYFNTMLKAEAVDVLQADATRCSGITGLLNVDKLCEAFDVPISTHCAPAIHLHPGCSMKKLIHAEYFFDHVRIEHLLFENNPVVKDGFLFPDLSIPGSGLELKHRDAEKYRVV